MTNIGLGQYLFVKNGESLVTNLLKSSGIFLFEFYWRGGNKHILFCGLQEHGDLVFNVRLSEDVFDVRPVLWFLTQHPLYQFSQLGVVLTRHLGQLNIKSE